MKGSKQIRAVRLDKPNGALRCGVFRRGETYEVGQTYGGRELTPELAEHLVKVKGFTDVSGGARARAESDGDELNE